MKYFPALLLGSSLLASAQVAETQKFSVERWLDMGVGYDVDQMVTSDKFHQAPNSTSETWARVQNLAIYEGVRMRGYLTAPESGNYTFWVSAKASGQIWLSTDDTKYRKELLCYLGANSGSGTAGVWQSASNLWDQYSTQMSEEVYLEAGQRYYIEALGKSGHSGRNHLSLAWATPSTERKVIPLDFTTTYAQEAEDADDDFLPDAWETLHGLDVEDNGLSNRAKEGERGDADSDGLNNRLEYVLGLDPNNPDSDGDGLSDGQEYHNYGTDPSFSDAPGQEFISDVNLSQFSSDSTITWTSTSQGHLGSSFRGSTTWDFNVPADGYWTVKMITKLVGTYYKNERVDFQVSIDGNLVKKITLPYADNGVGVLDVLTPYLSAGNHSLTLYIDNLAARRAVSLQGIQILKPTGTDLDSDGVVDWVATKLKGENYILPHQSFSQTSPAFIEGFASSRNSTLVNSSAALVGVDDTHWYANVPLNDEGSTPVSVQFTAQQNANSSIQWLNTNIFTNDTLVVRKGDRLKLVAQPVSGLTNGSATLTLPGVNLMPSINATATQSSTAYTRSQAYRAVDGNTHGKWYAKSISQTTSVRGSWLKVDLGGSYDLDAVVLWNRTNNESTKRRLSNYRISVLDSSGSVLISEDFHTSTGYTGISETWKLPRIVTGRYIKIENLGLNRQGNYIISLAEVQAFTPIVQTLSSDADAYTETFTKAGLQRITATHSNGETGTLMVDVKQAESSRTVDFVNNVVGQLSINRNLVSSDVFIDTGEQVDMTYSSSSSVIDLYSYDRGAKNILYRLEESGPVVGVQELNFIGFSDAAQNDVNTRFLSRDFVGYVEISTPIVVTNIPEGGKVVVTIFRGGVSFLDGTAKRTLTAGDFTEGVATLEFLFPIGLSGSHCHYVTIYDRYGKAVTRR